jgi:predicted HAD superfamily Cof-like phosphohydrolase
MGFGVTCASSVRGLTCIYLADRNSSTEVCTTTVEVLHRRITADTIERPRDSSTPHAGVNASLTMTARYRTIYHCLKCDEQAFQKSREDHARLRIARLGPRREGAQHKPPPRHL